MIRAWFWMAAIGCAGGKDDTPDDADGDTDTDADTDSDTDADTDADSDADTDTDTEPLPDADNDGSPDDEDCDDADPAIYPGAPDLCGDGLSTDCDRTSDDGLVNVDGTAGYDDLQLALDAASAGSEVLLCPGTYLGSFVAAVAVDLVSLEGSAATVVDGDSAGTALTLPGDSTITGLTVTGGRTNAAGGGILMSSPGALTVTGSIVSGNRADQGGGISTAADSDVVLVDTLVQANEAAVGGGGIYVAPRTTLDLTGCAVEDNTADVGGGVLVDGGTLIGGLVQRNEALSVNLGAIVGGTGVAAGAGSEVIGTEITGNLGTIGALSGCAGAVTFTDVDVHDNQAVMYAIGAGIAVYQAEVTLVGTSISRANRAFGGAGAFVVEGTLIGGLITENVADLVGGGVAASFATLDGVEIVSNSAPQGGGLWPVGDATVIGGRIASNQALESGGGVDTAGLFAVAAPVVVLEGVEVVDNTAGTFGGGLSVDIGSVTLEGSTVHRNQAATGGGATVSSSGLLSSVATDWGVDADDNLPSDVSAGDELAGYGADATFDCDAAGCVPAP